jgi:hypothetical protein
MRDEYAERREQRNKRILTWVLIVILALSAAGYYFGAGGGDSAVRYNGITFTPSSKGVLATIHGTRYAFNYLPTQVEGIHTDPGVGDLLKQPVLYLSYDPASNYSQSMAAVQYYLLDLLGGQYNVYVIPSVTQNESIRLPIVTCANATAAQPVLLFSEDNATRIGVNGTCITATAESEQDVYRLEDKLVFLALGVMDR